jgi:hypothetical protein
MIKEFLYSISTNGTITIGATGSVEEGTIRYNNGDFEGWNGSNWISFSSGGGSLKYSSTDNYIENIGITHSHNFGTTDVVVNVVDTVSNETIYPKISDYQNNYLVVTLSEDKSNIKVIIVG